MPTTKRPYRLNRPPAPIPDPPVVAPAPVVITEPAPKAPPVVLVAGAIAGVVGAIAIPLDDVGIGWLVGGLGMTAGVHAIARTTHAFDTSRPVRLVRLGWTVLALVLLAVGAFRAAAWLVTLCVLGAGVAGSLAVAGGGSIGQVLLGTIAVPVAALRNVAWLGRGLAALPRGGRSRSARLAVSVAIGVVLVVVFGALFAGADATFARLVSAALPTVHGGSAFRWLLVFVLAGTGTAAAGRLLLDRRTSIADAAGRRTVRRLEWAVPVGALVVLFAAFVTDQIAVLFGGAAYVRRTADLTYAQYARSGFWELLAVTLLTLVVISVAARLAPSATRADRLLLRGLLGALAGLTLVVVASALVRMWSYQRAYGFTVLRLDVETCELWLGVVYVLVIAAGVRLRLAWLPRTVVASALVGLCTLAVLNPERLVAAQNVARWQETGRIDLEYLAGLSTDAVPGLVGLPADMRGCLLVEMRSHVRSDGGWQAWNLSRATADLDQITCPTTLG